VILAIVVYKSRPLFSVFHMPDKPLDDDIRDVMAEEESRGKRPLDLKARKEKAELLRQVREALGLDTEIEFRQAIRGLQLDEDPKRLEEAVRLWRSFSSSRRK
jgi:hypothetical protein